MFYFGVDYYPEHWPEERWVEDVRMMADANFNVVRLAEFAWSKMEPIEGQFDFEWLDRVISILSSKGIQVVLGTPTASPPPWLMSKGEDMFLVVQDGHHLTYGNRRVYCPNNSVYQDYSQRIVVQMARHYKDNPAVIGWQIDNEFGSRCYCDICKNEFHRWLMQRYKTLAEVNESWGTIFWSHVYYDWTEIPVPLATGNSPNPGLALDYYRFMTESYVAYQKMQIDILRQKCPDHFITHNMMGFKYDQLNYFDMARDLDFVSWDIYWRTQWNMKCETDPSWAALGHDTMRGLKGQNYWVMEQQSGGGGWDMVSIPPKPGELRLWTYQSIGHGADAIVYFRWRTCRTGTEQNWHGILDHHGIPGRRYDETVQIGRELKKIGEMVSGSVAKPQVAIMQSYDTRFAFQIQPNNPRFKYEEHFQDVYRGFHSQNIMVDIISEKNPLTGYKVVVVPAMFVLPQETATNLENFTAAGGIVVFTPRTGVKNESNTVVNTKLPGLVAKMCGTEVEEYVSMPIDEDGQVRFRYADLEDNFPVSIWADVLAPKSADVIAWYTQEYYKNMPATTLNLFGAGKVIYIGCMGDTAFYETIARTVSTMAGIEPLLDAPDGVEVVERWQDDKRLLFVLNHTNQEKTFNLDKPCKNLLDTSYPLSTYATIAPNEVLILAEESS